MWKEGGGRGSSGLASSSRAGPNPFDTLVDEAVASASAAGSGESQHVHPSSAARRWRDEVLVIEESTIHRRESMREE